jgi:hypothetical protein
MAFKPEDVEAGLRELLEGQTNTQNQTIPNKKTNTTPTQYNDQSTPDGQEDGETRPDNTSV